MCMTIALSLHIIDNPTKKHPSRAWRPEAVTRPTPLIVAPHDRNRFCAKLHCLLVDGSKSFCENNASSVVSREIAPSCCTAFRSKRNGPGEGPRQDIHPLQMRTNKTDLQFQGTRASSEPAKSAPEVGRTMALRLCLTMVPSFSGTSA